MFFIMVVWLLCYFEIKIYPQTHLKINLRKEQKQRKKELPKMNCSIWGILPEIWKEKVLFVLIFLENIFIIQSKFCETILFCNQRVKFVSSLSDLSSTTIHCLCLLLLFNLSWWQRGQYVGKLNLHLYLTRVKFLSGEIEPSTSSEVINSLEKFLS